MSATAALLERRLNAVLLEFVLQLQQVVERALVVCVEPPPRDSLCFWVDRADLERTLAASSDAGHLPASIATSPPPLGAVALVVVVPPRLGVRPVRLTRVCEAIHEPLRVLSRAISGVASRASRIGILYTRFLESQSELPLPFRRPEAGGFFGKVRKPEVSLIFCLTSARAYLVNDAVGQIQQPEAGFASVVVVHRILPSACRPAPLLNSSSPFEYSTQWVTTASATVREECRRFRSHPVQGHIHISGIEHLARAYVLISKHLISPFLWLVVGRDTLGFRGLRLKWLPVLCGRGLTAVQESSRRLGGKKAGGKEPASSLYKG